MVKSDDFVVRRRPGEKHVRIKIMKTNSGADRPAKCKVLMSFVFAFH
jgi:hypothetical protein